MEDIGTVGTGIHSTIYFTNIYTAFERDIIGARLFCHISFRFLYKTFDNQNLVS